MTKIFLVIGHWSMVISSVEILFRRRYARPMQGQFIVFEGPDGAGTTTHSVLLAETLKREGKPVLLTAEPTDGLIGRGIRELLKVGGISGSALQLLFCADRADHQDAIEQALERGDTVICDRYIPSTIAYGSALGLDVLWLRDVNRKFRTPDITFVLLPPLQVCIDRLKLRSSSDALEHDSLREHVYDAYQRLAEADPLLTIIDTSGHSKDVAKKIRVHINFAPQTSGIQLL